MNKKLTCFFRDIRHARLFPLRYGTTMGKTQEYWAKVAREHGNFKKRVDVTRYRWWVITYRDGRQELAYFRVRRAVNPHGGRLCRGIIFPRIWSVADHEHTKDIRLAF